MKFPDACILVFAKAPIPGQCKTRLIPALGEIAAAKLHQKLVIKTLKTATENILCPVELWCTPTQNHPFFIDCTQNNLVTLHQQQGNNLGQRMHHAISSALKHCHYVILIGCDCPLITTNYLSTAIKALEKGKDAVIGPAEDGGYVLIGLSRRPVTLFNDITWGSRHVLKQTQQQLEQLDFNWEKLKTLWDIDNHEDWLRYQEYKRATQI